MVINKDFKEFIQLLNDNHVRYLVVGGYAVGFHGYPRYTKELDIWIEVSDKNAANIMNALYCFGFKGIGLDKEDFLKDNEIIQLGYSPNRIDIVTSCEGVDFEESYRNKITLTIDNIKCYFIDIENLRKNKKASGWPQDLADLENLTPKA